MNPCLVDSLAGRSPLAPMARIPSATVSSMMTLTENGVNLCLTSTKAKPGVNLCQTLLSPWKMPTSRPELQAIVAGMEKVWSGVSE
nr:hypothetical protein Itr_chr06CG21290 [Ipomoea trifida]